MIGELWAQNNLKGLWHFNGNSNDSSGNSNNGTDTSVTYSQANGLYQQGVGGFNGSSSKIAIADSASLHFGTGDISIMGWIAPDLSVNSDVFHKASSAGHGYILIRAQTTGNALIQFYEDGSNNVNFTGSSFFTTNVWAHIAVVLTRGSGCYLYKNGALFTSGTITGTPSFDNTGALEFMGAALSGVYGKGKLDEWAIFSRSLTAAEVRKWYAWSKGRLI